MHPFQAILWENGSNQQGHAFGILPYDFLLLFIEMPGFPVWFRFAIRYENSSAFKVDSGPSG